MSNWPQLQLGDVVQPTEKRDPRNKPDEEFTYVDIASIDNKSKEIIETKKIIGAEAPSRARKIIRQGDIIVSTVRPNLNAVATISEHLDNQICSTGFSVLRPNSKLISGYLFAFVRSKFFINYLASKTRGANYPAVNDKDIKEIDIPIPSIKEQKRIVKILDEADALRKSRAEADRRTADLIPALFHKIFSGSEKSEIKSLDDICTKITDGVHLTPTYVDSGIPFLRVTDIKKGTIKWNKTKCIPEEEYKNITRRIKPELGDILYSKNGTIGIAKEITWNHSFAHFVSLALLKPKKDIINSTFLECWLNTPDALMQATGNSRTGTVTNLHLREIKKICIPCPPMDLQLLFIKRVSEIRQLQVKQAKSRQRLDDLFQSCLHRAFNGEL